MNKFKLMIMIITSTLLLGCTDGARGKIKAYGGSADIKCYSAELLIYEGTSTGRVASSESSDGYYFIDVEDLKLKEVSGNCVIEYKDY